MRSKPKKYTDVQLMQISLGFMIKNKHKKKMECEDHQNYQTKRNRWHNDNACCFVSLCMMMCALCKMRHCICGTHTLHMWLKSVKRIMMIISDCRASGWMTNTNIFNAFHLLFFCCCSYICLSHRSKKRHKWILPYNSVSLSPTPSWIISNDRHRSATKRAIVYSDCAGRSTARLTQRARDCARCVKYAAAETRKTETKTDNNKKLIMFGGSFKVVVRVYMLVFIYFDM